MNKEEKELIELLENCIASDLWYEINNDNATILGSYINKLQQENKQLKEEKQNAINYIVKELIEINKHQYAKGSRRLKKILELLGDGNE